MPEVDLEQRTDNPPGRSDIASIALLVALGAIIAIGLLFVTASVITRSEAVRTPVPPRAASASTAVIAARHSLAVAGSGTQNQSDPRYYSESKSGQYIEFGANGGLTMSYLGALSASYTLDGDTVRINGGIFGSATGQVGPGRVTFDGGSGTIGNALFGIWTRR